MNDFIRLTIFGLVSAAVYFVAASGLVLTYATSGIFNFAQGAIGMMAAFVYWELRVHHHWPAPLAIVVVLFVLAPLFGAVLERLVIRNLRGASLATTLVVTVGLLAGLIGLAQTIWKPASRTLPGFYDPDGFHAFGVFITWHRAITIIVALVVAGALRLLLYRSRIGIAMRAVVDNQDLASLNGVRPATVSSLSWALGCMLAALAGILLAPVLALDVVPLTLLVLNAYAAAMVGRLRSLPMTLVGAIILGLVSQYIPTYLPKLFHNDTLPNWLIGVNASIPVLMLFIVLLVLPEPRLRGWVPRAGLRIRVPSLRQSLLGAGLLVGAAAVVANMMSVRNVPRVGEGLALGIIALSLVPLTGWAGQVSLCQLTLAGVGAFAMAKLGATGSPVGLLAAVALAGVIGAVIALPSLRLQGLYLALSTLAVAVLADNMFFPQQKVFFSGAIPVGRLDLGFVRFNGERAYFTLLAVAYALLAVMLLALRRGRFGRRLAALRDSPAACATLGMDPNRTKLAVFALSAAIAGLGGALYGGLRVTVRPEDFTATAGLSILVVAVIGGIATVSGALFGAMSFALIKILSADVSSLSWVVLIAPGFVGVTLGLNPDGAVPDIARRAHPLLARFRARGLPAVPDEAPPPALPDAENLDGVGIELPFGAPLRPGQRRALDRALGLDGALEDLDTRGVGRGAP